MDLEISRAFPAHLPASKPTQLQHKSHIQQLVGLVKPVAQLPVNLQGLLEVLECLPKTAKNHQYQANVAQLSGLTKPVSQLNVNLQGLLVVLEDLIKTAKPSKH